MHIPCSNFFFSSANTKERKNGINNAVLAILSLKKDKKISGTKIQILATSCILFVINFYIYMHISKILSFVCMINIEMTRCVCNLEKKPTRNKDKHIKNLLEK